MRSKFTFALTAVTWLTIASPPLGGGAVHAQSLAHANRASLPAEPVRAEWDARGAADRMVDVDLKDVPLASALKEIAGRGQLRLTYSPDVLPKDRRVSIRATEVPVADALQRALRGTGLEVRVSPRGDATVFRPARTSGQVTEIEAGRIQGTIAGRVTEVSTGNPLAGVRVEVVGTRFSAVTGADGAFVLAGVPEGTHQVRASRIGYGSEEQTVSLSAGETATVRFTLGAEAIALEGLVAVGYGTQRVEQLAGAVETVSPEEFNTGRVVSPQELIAAKVAGVQVVESGEPGGGINVRIRGGSSIGASNEPLFVIDGVPLPVGGGLSAGRNPLNFLNPDDIAGITVLKDVSATAIYGSRGANGVVLIETKNGGARGPQITYSGSVSTSRIAGEPDLLSADQFRSVVEDQAPQLRPLLGNANTDWRGAVQRDAFGQEHNVAFSGAGEDLNYRLSLGYLDQGGVLRGSDTERFSASLNYNHQLFGDRLSLQASVLGSRLDDRFTPGAVLGSATSFDPTQPIRRDDGYFEWTEFPLAPNNPVAELDLVQEEGTTYRSVGNVEATYRTPFLDGLSATTRLGYDVAQSERTGFFPSILRAQIESPPAGMVSRSNPTETTALLDAFLNYTGGLGASDSDLDATLGYSYETTTGDYPYFQARGLSSDLLGPSGIPTAEEELTRINGREGRLASFFGRVNYTFRDRYIATFSVRRDGSSRFGPENQWGTFPAAALAWRAGDETFLDGVDWLSDLKLRASWGVNGNQSFGDYLWVSSYRFGDAFSRVQFGDEFVSTIRPSGVDPNIKWEETTSYNVGMDYGLFNNRISGSVEYYFKDTDDLIFTVPVAAGTNLSNFITTNIGSVQNQGFEFSLNGLVVDGGTNGFRWEADFNAATNRNELIRINSAGGGSEQVLVGGIAGGVGSTIQVLQPGLPVNSFFVYRHKRDANGRPVNSDDALEMYEDLNGDGVINQSDRAPFESPAPDWSFGHTSNMSYRNADLSFTVRANLGNYVYNNLASNLGNFNVLTGTGTPVNLHASVLENGFAAPQYFSDVYVEDASFVRMDNLTVGYTFPNFRGAQQMRLFGTVQNPFTITGYGGVDPMSGLNGIDNNLYPRSRTFSAGVSVGF